MGRADAALSLHHFYHDGRCVGGDSLCHSFQIVVGHVTEAGHQRQERFSVLGVPGGAEGPHGAPVKAAHGGDYPRSAGEIADKLDGTLHRFCARVAQEDAIQVAGSAGGQLRQQRRPLIVVHGLAGGDQRGCLLLDSSCDRWVAVTHIGHAVPGDAVDVLATLSVPYPNALSSYQGDVALGVCTGSVSLFGGDDVLHSVCLSFPGLVIQ